MGPRDSRNTVAGAVIPRFTTASATRSSSARSSVVNTSAVELVEKAWESSARTLSHFSATDTLENEVITVWKGSQNLLSCGIIIIWRGWGGVNEGWDGKDTHVGPVLPERAPSEVPRSTAARKSTWVPFQVRKSKRAWKD